MLAALSIPCLAGTQPREGFVAADDGVRLFYTVVGDGPETVIVPGGFLVSPGLERLATGRRVVFYDMRGRGRSDRVADSTHITIQWDVRDLEAIRRHVGAPRVSLIGYSYLGLMVMLYAADHHDVLDRIVQIGPVPRRWDTAFPADLRNDDQDVVLDSAARAEVRRLRAVGDTARDQRAHCERSWMLTRGLLVGDARLASDMPSRCQFENEWPVNFNRHMRHHFGGSVQHLDVPWSTFERVTRPVLTVHGTRDRNAPYGGGREWATRLPNARLLTIQGAAHAAWIDQPAAVLGGIDTFLRGGWPAGAEEIQR